MFGAVFCAVCVLSLFYIFGRDIEVVVSPENVSIGHASLWMFHRTPRRTLKFSQIKSARTMVAGMPPLQLGSRFFKTSAFSILGTQGIEIELLDRELIIVASDDPEHLADEINNRVRRENAGVPLL